ASAPLPGGSMPTQRISMRKIRDVLRLKAAGLSVRQIGASTKLSVGAIQKLTTHAASLNLAWPLPEELDDEQLARCFYPGADVRPAASRTGPACTRSSSARA